MIDERAFTNRANWLLTALLLLGVFYCELPAGAQVETTTSLRGIVTDSTGAVVPGAAVSIQNVNTGETRTATTDRRGSYSFPALLPGAYTVTVTKAGFRTDVITSRALIVGEPAEVDATLQLGDVTQKITVSVAGQELLNTTTGEVSSLVSPQLVDSVPLNGRDFFDLAILTPGAVPEHLTSTQITFVQPSLNYVKAAGTFVASGVMLAGNRDSSANVSVDGANTQSSVYEGSTQLQSPDDIQEMKIESGNMNAEFGNGVTAVNVITKSGTNQLHGTAYDYLRNDAFDANSFFANLQGQGIPGYRVNQFGGAVGGPIKKDKLLFFADYEGYRLNEESFTTEQVPDNNLRNGDFSQYHEITGTASNLTVQPTPTIYNPYSFDPATGLRTPFPNNQIPLGATTLCAPRPTCADPAAVAFLDNWVKPPNGVLNDVPVSEGNAPTTISHNQYTGRIDWLKSSKAAIYGRYTYFSTPTALSYGLQPLEGTANNFSSQQAVVHWTQGISANLLNDLMLAYSRPIWFLTANANAPDVSKQIGLTNTVPLPGGPVFVGTPYDLDSTECFYSKGVDNKIQLKDDLSYVWGANNFKFGGDIINDRFIYPTESDFKGDFEFQPNWTTACPLGNATCSAAMSAAGLGTGGLAFSDFLLGSFYYALFQNNADEYVGHRTYLGLYGQDSWRATRKLTLNYGLRYEDWTAWLVPNNTTVGFNFQTSNIEYALQNPLDWTNPSDCFGACAPLNSNFPRQGYKAGPLDIAPRIGLAYLLTPKTVLRAGFGIFFDGNTNNDEFSNLQTGAAPFYLRDEYNEDITTPVPPALVSQEFPAPSPAGVPQPNSNPQSSFRFPMPWYPTPAVDQWSFSVQRTISSYWQLETDYIGSHTVHETQFIDVNAAALPQGGLASVPLQQRRPYPQWGTLGTWAPIGWSRYNGLMASLKNRAWHGLTFTGNFTWEKSIISQDVGLSGHGNTDFRDPYSFAGPSPITPYKIFIGGYSYALPFGQGKAFAHSLNPVLEKFVDGWHVSGITTFSTGSPQPVQTSNVADTGETTLAVPNRVVGCNPGSVPGGRGRYGWFNTNCFVQPSFGTYGDSTLGVCRR